MKNVLFICIHNSARSQMAEAFLHQFAGDKFNAQSAGLEPGTLNPLVVEVMKEEGIDLSGKQTQSVFDLHRAGKRYDLVIAVCSKEAQERCPIFPGAEQMLHWPFEDPSGAEGTQQQKLARVRQIRDQMKRKIKQFSEEIEV